MLNRDINLIFLGYAKVLMDKTHSATDGNLFDKYGSRNIIVRDIMKGFFEGVSRLLPSLPPKRILEVGCGDGFMVNFVSDFYHNKPELYGVDISENIINEARANYSEVRFSVQSVYDLDFEGSSFDLVLAFEILEHLRDPGAALEEICRVASGNILFTVPREPLWRILNITRLKYLSSMGNTPGHIQHWSKKTFLRYLYKHCESVEVLNPLPFIQVLCKKRNI